MKFKVKSLDLVNMLKIATKGYDSRDETSFVYLKTEEDKLTVVSRCKSAYFSGAINMTSFSSEENEPNIYYVDGEVLRKLVGIFPSAPVDIEFSVNDSSRVFVVKYTGSKLQLPIVRDTEEIEAPKMTNLGLVQGTVFMSMLNSLLKIVDNDSTAQEHPSSCLHMYFSKDEMKAMATDRFVLAELAKQFSGDEEVEEETFLLKHPQASLLTKTVGPVEVLRVVYSSKYFGYIDGEGNVSLVGRTDFTPLNYAGIKRGAGDDCNIEMSMADLREALGTISKLAFANDFVTLSYDKEENLCKLKSLAGDEIVIPVIGSSTNESISVDFTRSVLQKSLIPVDTENVRIEWPEENTVVYRLTPTENDVTEEGVFIGVVPNSN